MTKQSSSSHFFIPEGTWDCHIVNPTLFCPEPVIGHIPACLPLGLGLRSSFFFLTDYLNRETRLSIFLLQALFGLPFALWCFLLGAKWLVNGQWLLLWEQQLCLLHTSLQTLYNFFLAASQTQAVPADRTPCRARHWTCTNLIHCAPLHSSGWLYTCRTRTHDQHRRTRLEPLFT